MYLAGGVVLLNRVVVLLDRVVVLLDRAVVLLDRGVVLLDRVVVLLDKVVVLLDRVVVLLDRAVAFLDRVVVLLGWRVVLHSQQGNTESESMGSYDKTSKKEKLPLLILFVVVWLGCRCYPMTHLWKFRKTLLAVTINSKFKQYFCLASSN